MDERRAEAWRRRYREQLDTPVIPDYHEALCRLGRPYVIEETGRAVGYLIFAREALIQDWTPVIPEMHFELDAARHAKRLLAAVIAELRPKTIIGRTDDRSLFPLLMDMRLPNYISCPLYVLDRVPDWAEDSELTICESTLDDAQRLLPLYASAAAEDGGIADEIALAKSLAAWRHYRLLAGGRVTAVAYVAPQGQRCVTVAPIVAAGERRRGFGRYLASYAIRREVAEGKIIVAAVNPDNEAGCGLAESLGARLAAQFVNFSPAA